MYQNQAVRAGRAGGERSHGYIGMEPYVVASRFVSRRCLPGPAHPVPSHQTCTVTAPAPSSRAEYSHMPETRRLGRATARLARRHSSQ